MICYDFDKTIYKKDSAKQLLLFAMKKNIKVFFYTFKICFFALLYFCKFIKVEKFKEIYFGFLKFFDDKNGLIEEFWIKEEKNINEWFKTSSGGVVCSASPLFLIEPIIKKLNPTCIVYGTNLSLETFKINGKNLKGLYKKEFLEEHGYDKFDAVYTDSLSDFPLFDMTENKFLVVGDKVYEFGKQKIGFLAKIKFYIKELRIKHYVKNGLILLPLIFSGNLFGNKFSYLLTVLFGFIAFSCVASIIYLINDFVDVKKDRKHVKKRKRPYASYMLNKIDMLVMFVGLVALTTVVWIYGLDKNLVALFILLGYFVLNLLYSFLLKNIAIIDIFVLAACYVIRVYFGAVIVGVYVSKWLYLTIICASLYLGLGKRRGELAQSGSDEVRKVNKKYSFDFLDKNMNMCLTMCVVFYALWVVEYRVLSLTYVNSILFLVSIPLVIFILMKYSLNIEKDKTSSDPIEVFLHDYVLMFSVLIFIVTLMLAIYIPLPEVLEVAI